MPATKKGGVAVAIGFDPELDAMRRGEQQ